MPSKIYKYFSSDMLKLVFSRHGFCGIKCSLPKDYNDPYELFLGVDTNVSPELLATYREVIQELPQRPTTCFSKSPIVTPMWAHYAQNHSGFVLEFDLEALKVIFEDVRIRDVAYKDEPNQDIKGMIERALVTKKARHSMWLLQAVLSEAYFSKHTAWSYEEECRLVAASGDVEDVAGNDILFVPTECLTSIIVGKNFPEEEVELSKQVANDQAINWYRSVIGKSHPRPFLENKDGDVLIFDGNAIAPADRICDECSEPVVADTNLCPWCSITEAQATEAAMGNPFRMLESAGALDWYLEQVGEIERGRKK